MSATRTAIATLCVGSKYAALWRRYCAHSWKAYAERYGYALEVFNQPLDQSPRGRSRSPAWQKCLILSSPRTSAYDRIIWVDADIVIAPEAPPIVDDVPPKMIGAVISGDYLQTDMKAVFLERMHGKKVEPGRTVESWLADQRSYYTQAGIDCISSDIVQTGVLVFSQQHRTVLEKVYEVDVPNGTPGLEQLPLSAAILNRGLCHRMDSRFNLVFYERMVVHYPYLFRKKHLRFRYPRPTRLAVMTEYANSYFLHFAYDTSFMQFLDLQSISK
jgi:hypothetical protein